MALWLVCISKSVLLAFIVTCDCEPVRAAVGLLYPTPVPTTYNPFCSYTTVMFNAYVYDMIFLSIWVLVEWFDKLM